MTALISSSDNIFRSNAGMSAVPSTVTSCFARAKPSISVSKVHIPSGRSGKSSFRFRPRQPRAYDLPCVAVTVAAGTGRPLNFTWPCALPRSERRGTEEQ